MATQLVTTIADVRRQRWADPNLTWGLVPTMGALHEGHLSLVREAKKHNDRVGVSIFVNPTQFNEASDLEKYPRNLDADMALLEGEGVDLVWHPQVAEVYPDGYQTTVAVNEITKLLEGEHRPGHFAGVTTIVAKLFNVFQPNRAYFGQKDAQQVAVIKQMVRDLAFNLDVVACPIVREADGLAMSSRNMLLTAEEREAATVLFQALQSATTQFQMGENSAEALCNHMKELILTEPLARIDYVSVANPVTLTEIEGDIVTSALLSMAVYIGQIRLIDNTTLGR